MVKRFQTGARCLYFVTITLLVSIFVVGCQAPFFTYRGATAKVEIRLPLTDGGPHEGTWINHDIAVRYSYAKHPDSVDVSGDVELRHGYYVDHFFLWLHFLDGENRILESKVVVVAAHKKPAESYAFSEKVPVSPRVTAMAFSYDGKVSGTGDDGSWDFWSDPRRAGAFGVFY